VMRATPACAGRTPPRTVPAGPRRGLPPRARGGLPAGRRSRVPGRATPACAGRTSRRGGHRLPPPGYPRVCGADRGPAAPPTVRSGLPPRVRDGLSQGRACCSPTWATPACAGRTPPRPVAGAGRAGYPRVCGADEGAHADSLLFIGLPPRVRGGHVAEPAAARVHRATPACAGRTQLGGGLRRAIAGYPRVCGADTPVAVIVTNISGLPPRVRGGRSTRRCCPRRPRATPACAGRTQRDRPEPGDGAGYPRVCGADVKSALKVIYYRGLPPRVRGGRPGCRSSPATARATPACAGRTLRNLRF
jgi:hypothetical protein